MHPAKDRLVAFGQGKLAADESAAVELHLESCHACCETLLDLKDDTFTGLVRTARPTAAQESDRLLRLTDVTQPGTPLVDSTSDATLHHSADESAAGDDIPDELRNHARYRIVSRIGRGGMGDVYRAEHRLMNRPVAVKLINARFVRNLQAVERFRREVRAAARLTHPNIVAAYDAEQAGDAHFLVMEYVTGTDLATYVKQHGPLSVAEACRCARQAAAGLTHAHAKGMVHRDVKPHNLMLSAEGDVRILDFGLAAFASEATVDDAAPTSAGAGPESAHLTTVGSVMGTPDYIAPEQARDAHAADIRSDIYSLGCTLWFLLTGKPPFEADGVFNKLVAHAEQPPPSLVAVRRDAPPELQSILARMMAKVPEHRFQSPAEVVEALTQFTQPPPRRNLGRWIAATTLALAALIAAAVIFVVTDKGEFIIEAADDVAVVIEESGIKIRDPATGREYRLGAGAHPIRSGEYQIVVAELPAGLEVSTDHFRLTRGGESRVTVRFEPVEPAPLDPASLGTVERRVLQAAEAALALLDAGKFDQAYDASSAVAKRSASKDRAVNQYRVLQETLGVARSRSLNRVWLIDEFPGVPGTKFACVEHLTIFEKRQGRGYESVVLNVDVDGQWRMNTFAFTLEPLPIPGPKTEDAPKSTSTPAASPSRPGPRLPSGTNLITDPSLAATPIGKLPRNWSPWFNDGPASEAGVVEGGRTDAHCLKITAWGTRAVVFADTLPLDRSKRYAIKGWAKFVGPASSKAIIKLNYFHNGKHLGSNDLVGVKAGRSDWQLLEKTDFASSYPEASTIVTTCTVEGEGEAWFDDLEMIAYDIDQLPPNFDRIHGRHNQPPSEAQFDLWTGRWAFDAEFKPTADDPGRKLTGVVQSYKLLGDRFLLNHSVGADAKTQFLTILTYDQNVATHRLWVFGSGGEAYERRGDWNSVERTLTLELQPPGPGVTGTSVERFIGDDRLESTLVVRGADGKPTRDVYWLQRRTSEEVDGELTTAAGPAADSPELAQLNKLAGEWTVDVHVHDAVWTPGGREETVIEKNGWILGGRCFQIQSFDPAGELKTLMLLTHEPKEASFRAWFFGLDGASGQWRVTWEPATQTYRWRAIDMPTGWIGTGADRFVSDDAVEAVASIKDETGRLLFGITQEKRRKK